VSQLEVSTAAAEAEYSRQLARNKEELAGLRATRGTELQAMLVRTNWLIFVVRVGMGQVRCVLFLLGGLAIVAWETRCYYEPVQT
jgi:uncharacterized membrane protein (DUF4010 family)